MAFDWTNLAVTALVALLSAGVVILLARLALRVLGRRWVPAADLERRARIPFRVLVLMVALNPVVAGVRPDDVGGWWDLAAAAARVLAIVTVGWFLTVVLLFVVDLALLRNRADVEASDNKVARRLRTQVLILRRLAVTVAVVITAGAVLLSFPGVEAVGASVLASAGLISVVAGLAAQTVLGNVFAGLQIAFSDSIRIDDAVIVEQEWGWIEEITLTYVVVRLWDERRMVLPSTYFTTTPFENWTRDTSQLLGSVELDLDWRVDTAALRDELDRALELTDLWDQRAKVLQVTDAVGGFVRIRVLVTARDAPTLFDLRCHVREHLVAWVRENADRGMPRGRVELLEAPRSIIGAPERDAAGLFHGDAEAEERAARMGGTSELPVVGEPAGR
ncbi:mechanosensitive ion channel family protein [Nocardioides alkalitolerans]|uniref:mechanosensitive ion channel family protein n=1 Tax=Nocardioides alkalitolerans TaxID=281714 RepID=UPI00048D898F|nr:mechanosensitive ion channel domain-containing protein [Nocardioides alkalitolerans]